VLLGSDRSREAYESDESPAPIAYSPTSEGHSFSATLVYDLFFTDREFGSLLSRRTGFSRNEDDVFQLTHYEVESAIHTTS